MTKITKIKILVTFLTASLLPTESLAMISGSLVKQAGSAFLDMFPAWISLAGAVIVMVLASKYMAGGALAKPFKLIGFGILVDALAQIISPLISSGLVMAPPFYGHIVLTAGLVFRLSVVAGVIWIAGIFGVLRQK